MRLHTATPRAWLAILHLLIWTVSAEEVFESRSLEVCQTNSNFSASLFNVVFTPNNRTVSFNIVGESSMAGNVILKVHVAAYGYEFLTKTLDPCELDLVAFCPLAEQPIEVGSTFPNLSKDVVGSIPGIAYNIPDLDATVTVYMYAKDNPTVSLACVRSRISNGKTVDQTGVHWATALVAALGFVSSWLVSGLGHANTAAHVGLYAMTLFQYFQAVAIIGLTAVPLPPIVQSWTQDFVWSVGVLKVGFLERFATWYQRATGGTPATILRTLETQSVQVSKRDLFSPLLRRAQQTVSSESGEFVVSGIQRVAFRGEMESTNLFFTAVTWYCILIMATLLGVTAFREFLQLAIRARWMDSHRFQDFRANFLITIKGITYRLLLMGYPPMVVLCLWEFTQIDSAGEVYLAVIIFFGMSAALALATWKVLRIAKRSDVKHKTPAYLLYADAIVLEKWGFLYIQFKATACYYIVPSLAYFLVKGAFIGLGQKSGLTQAVALIIIEVAALIAASVIRPWMDKPTNILNIWICVVNFLNAIFLLIFTNVFKGPGLLIGVTSLIFFIMNVVCALVLLFVVLIAAVMSLLRKNPEARYQSIADNRASFIRSQTALNVNTELDQLAYTAREAGDDSRVVSYTDKDVHAYDPIHGHGVTPLTPTTNPPLYQPGHHPARSYEDFHDGSDLSRGRRNLASPHNYSAVDARPVSPYSDSHLSANEQAPRSHSGSRPPNVNSPWQRGAGYES